MEFTEQEAAAIHKLAEAWAAFICLPTEHPSDTPEFREAIHRAQLLIMARPGRRIFNTERPNVSGPHIAQIPEAKG